MKKINYWVIYSLWFLYMMLLGSVYTFSIYRPFIEQQFKISTTLSGVPYMTSLMMYAISMFITGKLLRRYALKWLILVGGILFVTSWLFSAISDNIVLFTLSYGIMMGTAVGILYGASLQFVQRYTTHHTSFFVGVMLFAFGLSSVVLSPVASIYLTQYPVSSLFQIYGVISLVLLIPLFIIYPKDAHNFKEVSSEHTPYLRLLLIFLTATMIGLMMIGLTNIIGVQEYGYRSLDVAIAMSVFAFLNAISRPIFGYGLDRYGFKKMSYISIYLIAFASFLNLLNQGESLVLFTIGYGIYWFNLGAWLSLMPNYIKKKYGEAMYASLYGKVFLGYGISAIIGTLSGSILLETLGNSTSIYFLILGVLILLTVLIRKEII